MTKEMSTTVQDIFARIEDGAPMTLPEQILFELEAWEQSEGLYWMQVGRRYYAGRNDIEDRQRLIIGEDGRQVADDRLPNNRLAHGFLRKLVRQKATYLLGKPFSLEWDSQEFAGLADGWLRDGRAVLRAALKDAVICGIGWIHVYYDEEGRLQTCHMPPEQLIPVWRDEEHRELDACIRWADIEEFQGKERVIRRQVEYWDKDEVWRYILRDGKLLDETHQPHATIDGGEQGFSWGRVPFVPVRYNEEETPLIRFVKPLIDGYDRLVSDNSNTLEEAPNGIYVLKNYDGMNLGEFRKNLAYYRAVKVSGDGGLSTLSTPLDTPALEAQLLRLRHGIYEFGQGVEHWGEESTNNLSGIALRFRYAELDMDCAQLAAELDDAAGQALAFFKKHLDHSGQGDFAGARVHIVFNTDTLINESETIANLHASQGLLSTETLVAQHPYVGNVEQELARMKNEGLLDATPFTKEE